MSDETNNRVKIVPVDGTNYTAACTAAHKDKHASVGITDVIKKGEEVVGHISINGVPMILFWMDSTKQFGREALQVLDFVEWTCKRAGAKEVCVPCDEKSAFYPYMKKLGYEATEQHFTLFTKKL